MINIHYQIDRPSAYQTYNNVPERFRLGNFADDYEDRDLWEEFLLDQYMNEGHTEKYLGVVISAGEDWKTFCSKNNRHHGFATPAMVNDWCRSLLENLKKSTVKYDYFGYIWLFYRYLTWNVDYPHLYNPVVFAICSHEETRSVWAVNKGRDPCV